MEQNDGKNLLKRINILDLQTTQRKETTKSLVDELLELLSNDKLDKKIVRDAIKEALNDAWKHDQDYAGYILKSLKLTAKDDKLVSGITLPA